MTLGRYRLPDGSIRKTGDLNSACEGVDGLSTPTEWQLEALGPMECGDSPSSRGAPSITAAGSISPSPSRLEEARLDLK
jgi:hypothetical protein